MNSTDLTALMHLVDCQRAGHVLSPGELGELLSLSGPATTSVVDRLQRQGWVERRRDTSDGRRLELHLSTTVDLTVGHSPAAGMATIVREACAGHTREEITAFTTILAEISERLEFALRHSEDPAAQHLWLPPSKPEERVG